MNLSGDQIKNSYGGLLNIGASGADGTLQPVTDGFGNVLPFEVSTTTINFTGTVTGGPVGPTGAAGSSGTSGTSGVSGSSGTSGVNGSSGTSGANGSSGTSGTSGTSGINGSTGSSGSSGTSGVSGSSGTSGTSGANGSSGTSGTSGTDGTSGTSGTSGVNGATGPAGPSGGGGTSGTSGTDGTSGTSGVSGSSGTSGTSGVSGSSGTSGQSGSSGTSGTDGTSGTSGASGSSGTSGTSGVSGTSGTDGTSGTSGASGSSGTSGTSGVSGSSGTSGTSGTDGTSGTSGINGATGPAGPGASSPITIEGTNSLVSTGVGATGTTTQAIAIGYNTAAKSNCSVAIGSTSCTDTGSTNSVAIGNCALNFAPDSVVIGSSVCNYDSSRCKSIAIGSNVRAAQCAIAIGNDYQAGSGVGENTIAIGNQHFNNQNCTVNLGFCNYVAASGVGSIVIGHKNNSGCPGFCQGPENFKLIGTCNVMYGGATGTIVLGNFSSGGTGACDSTVIGNCSTASGPNAIAIGKSTSVGGVNSIAIGTNISSPACNQIQIGTLLCQDPLANCSVVIGYNLKEYSPNNVVIGQNIEGYDSSRCRAVAIGGDICHTQEGISIGQFIQNGTYRGFQIGYNLCKNAGGGSRTVRIGQDMCMFTDNGPIQLGVCNTSCSDWSIQIGENNTFDSTICSANCSSAIGHNNVNCHACSSIIGNGITTIKANAAHVNSLVALGQGASITHDNGNVGTSATIDWDNANNQTLTLIGSTTLTFSNPVSGANYLLEITQGGAGSYAITWPTIKWQNATPPTLSTAVGKIDIISLFYDGTSYFGTFALNFA